MGKRGGISDLVEKKKGACLPKKIGSKKAGEEEKAVLKKRADHE